MFSAIPPGWAQSGGLQRQLSRLAWKNSGIRRESNARVLAELCLNELLWRERPLLCEYFLQSAQNGGQSL